MPLITEMPAVPRALEGLEAFVGRESMEAALARAAKMRELLGARTIWNISSTGAGGGVAEMLASLLGYPLGCGIAVRWLVIGGAHEFFTITKRLHHALHGSLGDASPLDEAQRAIYERVLAENTEELLRTVPPGDIVVLHDPQTAGLAPALRDAGMSVIWRCHIGADGDSDPARLGWRFLAPYLAAASVSVFTRRAYVPAMLPAEGTAVIAPSIDPLSPKNEPLDEPTVRAVLARAGLVGTPIDQPARVTGVDGTLRVVDRAAEVVRDGPPPAWETPIVLQISRWDPLKDPNGVMDAFAGTRSSTARRAVLMLVGPAVTGVADDPEAATVLQDAVAHRSALPADVRSRIHLVALPTSDVIENATIVNALQRHATVVVQKSIAEGFGLTVTEAMWKARPVIATDVGGISDQIEDGRSGLLLPAPIATPELSTQLDRLLEDPAAARRIGEGARERVRQRYLPLRHLLQYADLIEPLLA